MKFASKIKEVSHEWSRGKVNITLETDYNETLAQELKELSDCEKLDVEIEKHKTKRSLDANAYAWVLMQKIAEAIHSDKWTVYLNCLEKYSRAFTHVIVKETAVDRMKELYRTCVDLGQVTVNGKTGHQLQVYFGSSTFNSKEMSVFIDGIISECKELGIETATPAEIERMKSAWQSS